MSAWTTAAETKKYALVKWDSLNYAVGVPFANEAAFDTFLDGTLIPRAQGHINRHCKRDFDVDYPGAVPDAIKDMAARATSNMLQYMVMNKVGPLVHQSQFQIAIPVQAVLTKELLDLLAVWVKRYPHTKATDYKTDKIASDWNEPTPTQ